MTHEELLSNIDELLERREYEEEVLRVNVIKECRYSDIMRANGYRMYPVDIVFEPDPHIASTIYFPAALEKQEPKKKKHQVMPTLEPEPKARTQPLFVFLSAALLLLALTFLICSLVNISESPRLSWTLFGTTLPLGIVSSIITYAIFKKAERDKKAYAKYLVEYKKRCEQVETFNAEADVYNSELFELEHAKWEKELAIARKAEAEVLQYIADEQAKIKAATAENAKRRRELEALLPMFTKFLETIATGTSTAPALIRHIVANHPEITTELEAFTIFYDELRKAQKASEEARVSEQLAQWQKEREARAAQTYTRYYDDDYYEQRELAEQQKEMAEAQLEATRQQARTQIDVQIAQIEAQIAQLDHEKARLGWGCERNFDHKRHGAIMAQQNTLRRQIDKLKEQRSRIR